MPTEAIELAGPSSGHAKSCLECVITISPPFTQNPGPQTQTNLFIFRAPCCSPKPPDTRKPISRQVSKSNLSLPSTAHNLSRTSSGGRSLLRKASLKSVASLTLDASATQVLVKAQAEAAADEFLRKQVGGGDGLRLCHGALQGRILSRCIRFISFLQAPPPTQLPAWVFV